MRLPRSTLDPVFPPRFRAADFAAMPTTVIALLAMSLASSARSQATPKAAPRNCLRESMPARDACDADCKKKPGSGQSDCLKGCVNAQKADMAVCQGSKPLSPLSPDSEKRNDGDRASTSSRLQAQPETDKSPSVFSESSPSVPALASGPVGMKYDKSRDQTLVSLEPLPVNDNWSTDLTIGASFASPGAAVVRPSTVLLTIRSRSAEGRFVQEQDLRFVADDQRVELGKMRREGATSTEEAMLVLERLETEVPVETFQRIAAASSLEMRVAQVDTRVGPLALDGLRDLASRIPPGSSASVVSAPAQRNEPTAGASEGFQSTKWGMSTVDVRKLYPKATVQKEDLFVVTEIASHEAGVTFKFANDKLAEVRVAFHLSYASKNDFLTEYDRLKDLLTKKYGAPAKDREDWLNSLYKNKPKEYGTAVAAGILTKVAEWETEKSEISLQCKRDDGQIAILARYACKEPRDLAKKADAAKDLSGL
jgi:hypothetical protein